MRNKNSESFIEERDLPSLELSQRNATALPSRNPSSAGILDRGMSQVLPPALPRPCAFLVHMLSCSTPAFLSPIPSSSSQSPQQRL
eukprot:3321897-Rhodomonas_salina.3